jgi:uncharacterized protein
VRILKALNRDMEGLIAATRHHHRLAVDLTKCHRAHPARVAVRGLPRSWPVRGSLSSVKSRSGSFCPAWGRLTKGDVFRNRILCVSHQTTPFRPISGRTRSKICQYSLKVDSESDSTVLVKSQPPILDELRSKLLSFCQKHTVQKLEVFGSVAEGTAKPGSDIDLMITLKPGSAESLHEFVGLQLELEDLLGCPVDLLERLAVESMKNPFKRRSILSCVKLLYAA